MIQEYLDTTGLMKKTYIFKRRLFVSVSAYLTGLQLMLATSCQKIEAADKNVKDMEFNFTQKINYVSTNEKQTSSGIVKYKKQNYIYMFQKNPSEQYTYIDGRKMTVYVPANKQAVVENWKDVLNSDMILTTIIGFGKNFRSFEKDHSIVLESQNDKEYVLLMKPNNQKQVWSMHINVDKETLLVNSAVFDNKNFIINVKLNRL
jgi:outer membrane lipoprotein-sorting protein